MDTATLITRRAAIVAGAAVIPIAMGASSYAGAGNDAEANVLELAKALSHALSHLSRPVRLTIEPSDTAAHPVLMEDIRVTKLMDHLDTMSRGLKMMEEGAMARDPSIIGLGMLWGIEGARYEHFRGVAVNYSRKAGA